mgnify:CR=1 FL=1
MERTLRMAPARAALAALENIRPPAQQVAQIAAQTNTTVVREAVRARRAGLVATRPGVVARPHVRHAARVPQDTSAAGRPAEYSAAQTTSTVVRDKVRA